MKRRKRGADGIDETPTRGARKRNGEDVVRREFFVSGPSEDVDAVAEKVMRSRVEVRAKDIKQKRVRKRRQSWSAKAAEALGYTRIEVLGKGGARALGAIMKVCRVSDVRPASDGVCFCVPSKLLSNIVALLDNLCYDYKIIGRKGIAPAMYRTATRAGLALGAAIFVAVMAVYPHFVTRVSVAGVDARRLDGALNAKVQQILSSHGVEEGKWLGNMDAAAISKELLRLDGVAYADIERHGTHIRVLIKQELPKDELFEIEGSEVRATRLATVTRVIVEGGTAAVKQGDVVRPGDALIDGYVMYGDDRIAVEAKGRAYGTVLYEAETFFADTVLEKSYGGVKRVTRLGFFGRAPKAPDSPFERYELRTSAAEIGFMLPISCYTYEFREVTVRESQETRDDEQLIRQVYSSLLERLEEEAEIKNVYSGVKRTDGGRSVSVMLEAEVLIS